MDYEHQRLKDFSAARANSWMTALGMIAVNLLTIIFPALIPAICSWKQETVMIVSVAAFNLASLLKWRWDRRAVQAAKSALPVILLLLSGCSSLPQTLSTDVFYRRDLPICEESFGCFEGMVVLPKKDFYKFNLAPKGGAEIDLFVATTAHRNDSFEPTHSSWTFWKKRNSYEYLYRPNPELEGDGDNTLVFQTFEKQAGRHSWGVVLFLSDKYQLPFTTYCNGYTVESVGVAGCQSKTGLKQGIRFKEPVMIEADANCPVPSKVNGIYEWAIGYKQCGYTFRGASGKLGTLLAVGYRGELVRELK